MKLRSLLLAVVLATVLGTLAVIPLAFGQSARTAKLSWGAVTQNAAGETITGVTYRVYEREGTAYKRIAENLTALTFTATASGAGPRCYAVTAFIAEGGESERTNDACKTFPSLAPARPGTLQIE